MRGPGTPLGREHDEARLPVRRLTFVARSRAKPVKSFRGSAIDLYNRPFLEHARRSTERAFNTTGISREDNEVAVDLASSAVFERGGRELFESGAH